MNLCLNMKGKNKEKQEGQKVMCSRVLNMSNEIFMSLIHRNVTVISKCKVSSNVKMTMTSWTVIFLNDVFY